MPKKKALITGINGQDGSYLAELLLEKGYEVVGTMRRSSIENSNKMSNIRNIADKIKIHTLSLENNLSVYKLFLEEQPDECYHLAAASFVSFSFEDEISTIATNFNTTHYILSTIKELAPQCRLYFAGSSEIFGDVKISPQNETSEFNPRSIYGISKLASHQLIKNYREQNKIFCCTGFTYNHESQRRGLEFVTRKITNGAAKIFLGLTKTLDMGNIDAQRDWGYAPDYVRAMWLMLNDEKPQDYVIATGELHSVRDVLEIAFGKLGLDYKKHVCIKNDFIRPESQKPLLGDPRKIRNNLQWTTTKSFTEMIEEMVLHDVEILKTNNI